MSQSLSPSHGFIRNRMAMRQPAISVHSVAMTEQVTMSSPPRLGHSPAEVGSVIAKGCKLLRKKVTVRC